MSALLSGLLREGAVPEVAGQLLGEPALLYKEKINYKTAGGAGFSPHQDKPAYPFVDTGPLRDDRRRRRDDGERLPRGRERRRTTRCSPRTSGAASRRASSATFDWQPVELRAGQTLFFHALTPHRSGPNRSARDRRALYPTYNGRSEGDLRDEYYAERRRALADADGSERVRLSLIGDFEGRPA